jgi:hypothetical protein
MEKIYSSGNSNQLMRHSKNYFQSHQKNKQSLTFHGDEQFVSILDHHAENSCSKTYQSARYGGEGFGWNAGSPLSAILEGTTEEEMEAKDTNDAEEKEVKDTKGVETKRLIVSCHFCDNCLLQVSMAKHLRVLHVLNYEQCQKAKDAEEKEVIRLQKQAKNAKDAAWDETKAVATSKQLKVDNIMSSSTTNNLPPDTVTSEIHSNSTTNIWMGKQRVKVKEMVSTSMDIRPDDWLYFSEALDVEQPDDVISNSIHCNPTPRTNIWMVDQCVNVKVEKTVEVEETVSQNL